MAWKLIGRTHQTCVTIRCSGGVHEGLAVQKDEIAGRWVLGHGRSHSFKTVAQAKRVIRERLKIFQTRDKDVFKIYSSYTLTETREVD